MRVSVRRTPEPLEAELALPTAEPPGVDEEAALPLPPTDDGLVRVEAPMVGTFYRAPQPGAPPFVEEGDAVGPGQTLCVLEAMKLMNEVKADIEGVVRAIHVGNAEPVEFGQLLFELEPINGRPFGL
jgi:acetyl-CoA carboxylase biotin carboxyl carrier protein